MKFYKILVLAFSLFLIAAPLVCAKTEPPPTSNAPPTAEEAAKSLAEQAALTAAEEAEEDEANISYVYERPGIEKFSQLYWALGKLDIKSDADVDYFLMINECDIYKDYFHNEFEWQSIRAAGRNFIQANKNKFSLRFEVTQPLKLGEYDIKKNAFEILNDYQFKGTRRFEVQSPISNDTVCGYDIQKVGKYIPNYPRGLLIELSRPLKLQTVPVESKIAEVFIDEKMRPFKLLNERDQTQEALYDLRNAYLVIRVKLFAYRQETQNGQGMLLAEVLGILEGIEIYSDAKKKKLLYAEDYKRKKKNSHNRTGGDLKESGSEPMLLDDGASMLGN